jgi:hypothetical protein
MINKTFKELSNNGNIDLEIKKSGLSLSINFSKEFLKRFDLEYGDIIRLNNAEIIKQ